MFVFVFVIVVTMMMLVVVLMSVWSQGELQRAKETLPTGETTGASFCDPRSEGLMTFATRASALCRIVGKKSNSYSSYVISLRLARVCNSTNIRKQRAMIEK